MASPSLPIYNLLTHLLSILPFPSLPFPSENAYIPYIFIFGLYLFSLFSLSENMLILKEIGQGRYRLRSGVGLSGSESQLCCLLLTVR